MVNKKSKNETRQKRHLRIRKNISGTSTTTPFTSSITCA